ncbi:hypothetical protein B0H66DRAFT_290813 [Apodospora peruviana]|uniref:Uncharacterized protein n=1 Tax=Apodospora peruviana TaxID=516989 RepID=A0AAE0M391_9PEZI|nr:hypothetical protein B0H66DRAFT_290813 [Apodospora peruviana]
MRSLISLSLSVAAIIISFVSGAESTSHEAQGWIPESGKADNLVLSMGESKYSTAGTQCQLQDISEEPILSYSHAKPNRTYMAAGLSYSVPMTSDVTADTVDIAGMFSQDSVYLSWMQTSLHNRQNTSTLLDSDMDPLVPMTVPNSTCSDITVLIVLLFVQPHPLLMEDCYTKQFPEMEKDASKRKDFKFQDFWRSSAMGELKAVTWLIIKPDAGLNCSTISPGDGSGGSGGGSSGEACPATESVITTVTDGTTAIITTAIPCSTPPVTTDCPLTDSVVTTVIDGQTTTLTVSATSCTSAVTTQPVGGGGSCESRIDGVGVPITTTLETVVGGTTKTVTTTLSCMPDKTTLIPPVTTMPPTETTPPGGQEGQVGGVGGSSAGGGSSGGAVQPTTITTVINGTSTTITQTVPPSGGSSGSAVQTTCITTVIDGTTTTITTTVPPSGGSVGGGSTTMMQPPSQTGGDCTKCNAQNGGYTTVVTTRTSLVTLTVTKSGAPSTTVETSTCVETLTVPVNQGGAAYTTTPATTDPTVVQSPDSTSSLVTTTSIITSLVTNSDGSVSTSLSTSIITVSAGVQVQAPGQQAGVNGTAGIGEGGADVSGVIAGVGSGSSSITFPLPSSSATTTTDTNTNLPSVNVVPTSNGGNSTKSGANGVPSSPVVQAAAGREEATPAMVLAAILLGSIASFYFAFL